MGSISSIFLVVVVVVFFVVMHVFVLCLSCVVIVISEFQQCNAMAGFLLQVVLTELASDKLEIEQRAVSNEVE